MLLFNHPAYEHTTLDGAWRLENAIVVQTRPRLLVQGHGIIAQSVHSTKGVMLKYFKQALDTRRAELGPLATVIPVAGTMTTLTVDSVARLKKGMRIQIQNSKNESPEPSVLLIKDIDVKSKIVRYEGMSTIPKLGKNVVVHARLPVFGRYDGIEFDSGTQLLVRRVAAARSDYAPGHSQLADWYVAWIAADYEEQIRIDPDRAKFVKEHHRVDYTREALGGPELTVGWFPLFEPGVKGKKKKVLNSVGQITAIQPVSVGVENIEAWTWFRDSAADKRAVPVLRPKVT